MSLLRREAEGVCADPGGPLPERKSGVRSRCEACWPWEEGWAKPRLGRHRNNPCRFRSSRSRRYWGRPRRYVRFERPSQLAQQLVPGLQVSRCGSLDRSVRRQAYRRRRLRRQAPAFEGLGPEGHAYQGRANDRHGPRLRPARIERRSAGSPPQRSAKAFRSNSWANGTIRSKPKEHWIRME